MASQRALKKTLGIEGAVWSRHTVLFLRVGFWLERASLLRGYAPALHFNHRLAAHRVCGMVMSKQSDSLGITFMSKRSDSLCRGYKPRRHRVGGATCTGLQRPHGPLPCGVAGSPTHSPHANLPARVPARIKCFPTHRRRSNTQNLLTGHIPQVEKQLARLRAHSEHAVVQRHASCLHTHTKPGKRH